MTRTVFDNAMTAHVWASRSQPYGRSNNGNFYFDGRTLFSYGTHYAVGYLLPEESGVVLLNDDSSSVTTNGKHKPAAWRAVRHMESHSVPGLTETARAIDQALRLSRTRKGPRVVAAVAKHLESHGGGYWPGQSAAYAIFKALGASDANAASRSQAGEMRVHTKRRKAREAAEKRELDQNARLAKYMAGRDPAETAQEAREALAEAVGASQWEQERKEGEAAQLGREAHRAAKAAKAKGWPRIAAACRAHHKAARAEINRYNAQRERYATRAAIRGHIRAIRGAAEQIATYWKLNPLAHAGAAVPLGDMADAVRQCETGAKGFGELQEALRALIASPFARVAWPARVIRRAHDAHAAATITCGNLRELGGAYRMAWQQEARAAWYADGTRPPYQVGQLSDKAGGALLRATDVERDDSGQIVGGMLHTSWHATVPLAHAVRAFRFLKACREAGREWRANGHTIRVGHFRIDRITAGGDFVAGCHRINWGECARLAASLGLAELAASDDALEPSRAMA